MRFKLSRSQTFNKIKDFKTIKNQQKPKTPEILY